MKNKFIKEKIVIINKNHTVSDAKKSIIYCLKKNIKECDIDILIKPKNPLNDNSHNDFISEKEEEEEEEEGSVSDDEDDEKVDFPHEYPYLNYKNEYRILCDSQYLYTIGEETIYVVKKDAFLYKKPFVTLHYYINNKIKTFNFPYDDDTKVIDLIIQMNSYEYKHTKSFDFDFTRPVVLYMGKILNPKNKLKDVITGDNINFYYAIISHIFNEDEDESIYFIPETNSDENQSSSLIDAPIYLIVNNNKANSKENHSPSSSSSIDFPSFKGGKGQIKNKLLQYLIQKIKNWMIQNSYQFYVQQSHKIKQSF